MKLKDFVKPALNNGLGIHWRVGRELKCLESDVAFVNSLGIMWPLINGTINPQGPASPAEIVIRRLKDEGKMPIVRSDARINSLVDFGRVAERIVPITPWMQIYNEPANIQNWLTNRLPPNTRDYFRHRWIYQARKVAEAGGYPGLQCDTTELDAIFPFLALSENADIVDRMWFCPHLYPISRPPWVWEDERCSLGFFDFAEVFKRNLGFIPPMIVGEGGWADGEAKYNPTVMKEWYAWWLGGFQSGRWQIDEAEIWDLPDYLFAICPWILGSQYGFSWTGNPVYSETIAWMKANHDYIRRFSWEEAPLPGGDWRVVSDWISELEADLLRHDCEDSFGGGWHVEERK